MLYVSAFSGVVATIFAEDLRSHYSAGLNIFRFVPSIVLFWGDSLVHYASAAACIFYVLFFIVKHVMENTMEQLHRRRTVAFIVIDLVHAILLLSYKKAVQWSLVLTALADLVSFYFCFFGEKKGAKNN